MFVGVSTALLAALLAAAATDARPFFASAADEVSSVHDAVSETSGKLVYPKVRRDDAFVEDYFGTLVADPYRHLEDPFSSETVAYAEAQNALAKGYSTSLPNYSRFSERLREFYTYTSYKAPFRNGDNWYYFSNPFGVYNQSLLYRVPDLSLPDNDAEIFLDPGKFSPDGNDFIDGYGFSPSGKYFAFILTKNETDYGYIKIVRVADAQVLPDAVIFARRGDSLLWNSDETGFRYVRFVRPKFVTWENAGIENLLYNDFAYYFHSLLQPTREDVPCESDCRSLLGLETQDENVVSVKVADSRHPNSFVELEIDLNEDIEEPLATWPSSFAPFDHDRDEMRYTFQEMKNNRHKNKKNSYKGSTSVSSSLISVPQRGYAFESRFLVELNGVRYYYTNAGAPKYKVIALSPNSTVAVDVISETKNLLHEIYVVDVNKLLIYYLKDVSHRVKIYSLLDGIFLEAPSIPRNSIISETKTSSSSSLVTFLVEGYSNPGTVYTLSLRDPSKKNVWRRIKVPKSAGASDLSVRFVYYPSKDGVEVPMYIISKKSASLFGSKRPALLYAYGGFRSPTLPGYKPNYAALVHTFDAVVAVAGIRGGLELGMEWWDSGRLLNKQNCFDDFSYAAKYLVESGIAGKHRIGINGGSNGGLLVGAVLTQNPELFRVALPDYGVHDTLRFSNFTYGSGWQSDYGDNFNATEIAAAIKYSPVHNVRNITYPATFITTGNRDTRVVPLHSYKFAAQLQHSTQFTNQEDPILLRVRELSGHNIRSIQRTILTFAEKIAFWAKFVDAKWQE